MAGHRDNRQMVLRRYKMGYTWEVWAWVQIPGTKQYEDENTYSGNSAWDAVWAAIRLKRNGAGCVRVMWR